MVEVTAWVHNYLQLTENTFYVPAGFVDSTTSDGKVIPGDWRDIVQGDEGALNNLRHIGGNRYTYDSNAARSAFKDYFNSEEGAVEWQYKYVRSCGHIIDS